MLHNLKRLIPAATRGALRDALLGERAYGRTSYSQEGEDLLLFRLFEGQPPGIYVDVGAHHPHRFSNTFLLYQLGWRGLNIDARPGMAAAFRRTRSRDISVESGVSEAPQKLELHMFEESALNTFDPALAASRVAKGWKMLGKRWIDCRPLAEILTQQLPRLRTATFDLLSVDVEGLDLQVLRSNDWSKHRPRAVVAEILASNLSTAMASDMSRWMRQQGYELHAKLINSVLFLRQGD